MYGNVSEWTLDGYSKNGYAKLKTTLPIPAKDTVFQIKELHPRVARGGNFESIPKDCRSASRLASNEDWSSEDTFFPRSPWWYTDSPATGVGLRLI
ncbi:MAG: SUMF1/EgtB/PvdO family nonheme iron enzyme [Planctomycetota bacterium]